MSFAEGAFSQTLGALTEVLHTGAAELLEGLYQEDQTSSRGALDPDRIPSSSGAGLAKMLGGDDPSLRLRRVVGRGGYGEVWEAEQSSLGRVIAVKCVARKLREESNRHPDLSFSLAQMFRDEATITAGLEHPNIVPVYDLGLDAEGRPILAMKLVRGVSWRKLLVADIEDLDWPDYLRKHIGILVQVTQAVAFAHARGVIHRDLKPSQVMVGEFGEVLLMDWGLATVFDTVSFAAVHTDALTVPVLQAATCPAGTVAYMAPEQTDHLPTRLGPWTDVYLLGATLYQILSGRLPHDGKTSAVTWAQARAGIVPLLEKAGGNRQLPEELLRLVEDSLRPAIADRLQSAREFLDRLRDYEAGTSRRRASEEIVDEVAERLLAGGLDYRAYADLASRLEEARQRWPENPALPELRARIIGEFAEFALQNGDLVMAQAQAMRLAPGNQREDLLSRIAAREVEERRHRAQRRIAIRIAAASLLLLLFAAAFAAHRINMARGDAEKQRDIASAERDRSAAAREETEELVRFMLGDLRDRIGKVDPSLGSLDVVAQRALDHYRSLADELRTTQERLTTADALTELGNIFRRQGDLEAAEEALRQSHALILGAVPTTEQEKDQALNKLAPTVTALCTVLEERGGIARSEELQRDLVNRLGNRIAEIPHGGSKMILMEQYASASQSLGTIRYTQNDYPDAIALFQEARSIFHLLLTLEEDDREERLLHRLSVNAVRLGDILLRTGNIDEAEIEFCDADNIRAHYLELFPESLFWMRERNVTLDRLGQIHESRGELDLALDQYLASLRLLERMRELDPVTIQIVRNLGVTNRRISAVYQQDQRLKEAMIHAERAYELRESLAKRDPASLTAQRDLAMAAEAVGGIHAELGESQTAEDYYYSALDIRREMVRRDPANKRHIMELLSSYTQVLNTHEDLELPPELLDLVAEAMGYADSLLEKNTQEMDILGPTGVILGTRGNHYLRRGELTAAREDLTRATLYMQIVLDGTPNHYQALRAWGHNMLSLVELRVLEENATEARYLMEALQERLMTYRNMRSPSLSKAVEDAWGGYHRLNVSVAVAEGDLATAKESLLQLRNLRWTAEDFYGSDLLKRALEQSPQLQEFIRFQSSERPGDDAGL